MTKLSRRLIAILTIPLLLVLSSCIRMTADYEIVSEDEIKLVADIGMQNSFAEQMGSDMPDMCQQDESLGDVENASAEPYTEDGNDGYTGCRISGTATLADLQDGSTGITFTDDVWTFEMEGEENTEGGSEMSAEMFTDFRVSVTFPGEVLTHNGSSTVSGTTVTWEDPNDMFTAEGLHATAKNTGGGSVPWLWIILGAVALLAIGLVAFLLTRKKQTPPTGDGQPYPGAPQGQPYPGGPQGQPYPGAPQGQPTPPPYQGQGQPFPPQGAPFQPGGNPPQGPGGSTQAPQGPPPTS